MGPRLVPNSGGASLIRDSCWAWLRPCSHLLPASGVAMCAKQLRDSADQPSFSQWLASVSRIFFTMSGGASGCAYARRSIVRSEASAPLAPPAPPPGAGAAAEPPVGIVDSEDDLELPPQAARNKTTNARRCIACHHDTAYLLREHHAVTDAAGEDLDRDRREQQAHH